MNIKTLDFAKIKRGGEYYYDKNIILKEFEDENDIMKVKVLDLKDRRFASPIATIYKLDDNKEDFMDIGHLQKHPNILKIKYKKLLKYYKKNNPKYIIPKDTLFSQNEDYIIVGHKYKTNQVMYLNSNGVINTCHIQWVNWLNLKENKEYTQYINNHMNGYDYYYYDDRDF